MIDQGHMLKTSRPTDNSQLIIAAAHHIGGRKYTKSLSAGAALNNRLS